MSTQQREPASKEVSDRRNGTARKDPRCGRVVLGAAGVAVLGVACTACSGAGGGMASGADAAPSGAPDAGSQEAGIEDAAADAMNGGETSTSPGGGTPFLDSRCAAATLDTVIVDGLGGYMATFPGEFGPALSVLSGQRQGLSITAVAGPLTVLLGDYASPGLQAGATYPLVGAPSVTVDSGALSPLPFLRITAPNGAICDVDQGSATINTLDVADDGLTVLEAEVSWTGMSCPPDPFAMNTAPSAATGPGCFHVFSSSSAPNDAGGSAVDAGGGACPAPMGGACTQIANSAPQVATACMTATPPAMTGGSIAAGTYELTSDVYYVTDAANCPAAVSGSETLLLADGCLQYVVTRSNGDVNASVSYSAQGSTLVLSDACMAGAVTGVTATYSYTATANSLTLLFQGTSVTEVETLALQ